MMKKELIELNNELKKLATKSYNDIIVASKKLNENPDVVRNDRFSTTATVVFLGYGKLQATVGDIPDYFDRISWLVKGNGPACRSDRNKLVRNNARDVDKMIDSAVREVTPNPNLDNCMKSLKELDMRADGYVRKVDKYCDRVYRS